MSQPTDLKALGAQILNHALRIADDTVRSDVECYAHGFMEDDHPVYDTTRVQEGCEPEDLKIVDRAMAYIQLRGDVWPWVMKRQLGAPHLVRFVGKEPA